MSIETLLERIAVALEEVAHKTSAPAAQPGPAAQPQAAQPQANVVQFPGAAQPGTNFPQMQPPPVSGAAPQPQAAQPQTFPGAGQPAVGGQPQQLAQQQAPATTGGCPFNDAKGCTEYVMAAYTELGQEKGAGIQNCLAAVGAKNINEVQPQYYQQFWESVEAVRAA